MTNREFFNAIITGVLSVKVSEQETTSQEIIVDGEIIQVITDYAKEQIKKLDEKNEKKRNTVSKNQTANNEIKQQILDYMESETVYVSSALAEQFEVTTQKISALMRQLVESGQVEVIDNFKTKKGKVKGYKKV